MKWKNNFLLALFVVVNVVAVAVDELTDEDILAVVIELDVDRVVVDRVNEVVIWVDPSGQLTL